MSFLFVLSGALCSLIDKIFYGGSLDFIGISNLFIADIKDLYINLGLFFFIILIYKEDFLNDDNNTTFKDDLKSIKKFLVFLLKMIYLEKKKKRLNAFSFYLYNAKRVLIKNHFFSEVILVAYRGIEPRTP